MRHVLEIGLFALSVFFFIHFTEGNDKRLQAPAERYCNRSFNYCVKYPGSLLPHKQELPGSSGIALQPADRTALVTVWADTAAAGQSPKIYFERYLNRLPGGGDDLIIFDTIFGADYYEAYFNWQSESLFHQAFFFERYCVSLIARVPGNHPWLLQRIREEVRLEFPER